MDSVSIPPTGSLTWLGLQSGPLPIDAAQQWAVRPECGAVVVFSGTARDHSDGRPGVSVLEYEAYEEQVRPRLAAVADEARRRWPDLVCLVMIHRVGPVAISESAVVVVASSPHRDVAFDSARFCIDRLKTSVPIWKREVWSEGESWGLEAQPIVGVEAGR